MYNSRDPVTRCNWSSLASESRPSSPSVIEEDCQASDSELVPQGTDLADSRPEVEEPAAAPKPVRLLAAPVTEPARAARPRSASEESWEDTGYDWSLENEEVVTNIGVYLWADVLDWASQFGPASKR